MFASQSLSPEAILMIVCDDKDMPHANYLMQLISQTEENLSAAIYTTKVYTNNLFQLSSKQHIVFIGNSHTVKEQRQMIHDQYCEYGMHYGWLGKRAVLYVDDACKDWILPEDKGQKYHDFLEYSKTYGVEHSDVLPDILKKVGKSKLSAISGGIYFAGATGALALALIGVSSFLTGGASIALSSGIAAGTSAAALAFGGKVKAQQYQTLLTVFYQEGLKPFMEG